MPALLRKQNCGRAPWAWNTKNTRLSISTRASSLQLPEEVKINNVAFIDDLALVRESTESIDRLLNETVSFLDLHGIKLNATKTVPAKRIQGNAYISIKGDPVGLCIEDGQSFRYLGVQLSLSGRHVSQITDLLQTINQVVATLNSELKNYYWQDYCLFVQDCVDTQNLLQIKWSINQYDWSGKIGKTDSKKLLKAKCSLPRCISNAVLFSPTGYDVPKILDKVDKQDGLVKLWRTGWKSN
jgi:hypothetical protein